MRLRRIKISLGHKTKLKVNRVLSPDLGVCVLVHHTEALKKTKTTSSLVHGEA